MANVVYFNGKFVHENEAVIPITTHALQYGTGCFEGIRAYYNKKEKSLFIFRLEDHFKRLESSCHLLHIKLPHDRKTLIGKTIQLVVKNFAPTDLYIRPIAYKKSEAIGNFNLDELENGFAIYTVPLGRYLNTTKGVHAMVSSWRRVPDNAIPPRAKITGSYVNTTLAKTESLRGGFEEAIFLDMHDKIVEGSSENIFMVKNDVLITPPLSEDILGGITRETVITLAKKQLSLSVFERTISRSEIYTADEVFLTGTGAEITPVITIDRIPIGQRTPGKITRTLATLYYDIVHGDNKLYRHWVTEVKQ